MGRGVSKGMILSDLEFKTGSLECTYTFTFLSSILQFSSFLGTAYVLNCVCHFPDLSMVQHIPHLT